MYYDELKTECGSAVLAELSLQKHPAWTTKHCRPV